MEIQLNKPYTKNGSSTGEEFIPVSVVDNIVKFSNGAQCTKEIFFEQFVEHVITPSANEASQISSKNEDEALMELFTNYNNGTLVDENINNQIDLLHQGKLNTKPRPITPSVSSTRNELNQVIDKKEYMPPEIVVDDRGDIELVQQEDEPVYLTSRRLHDTKPAKTKGFKEIPEYEKVNRDKEVELNIQLTIKLPKPQHIEFLREMYTDSIKTDYIDYVVSKYIYENMTDDNKDIKDSISKGVVSWMMDELGMTNITIEETNDKNNDTSVDAVHLTKEDIWKMEIISNDEEYNYIMSIIANNISYEQDFMNHINNLLDEYEKK